MLVGVSRWKTKRIEFAKLVVCFRTFGADVGNEFFRAGKEKLLGWAVAVGCALVNPVFMADAGTLPVHAATTIDQS